MRRVLRQGAAFAREVWAELTVRNRPLPNPPDYKPPVTFFSLPIADKARVLMQAFRDYIGSFRAAAEIKAERAAKLRAAVQEQTDALKELAQHTKGAAADAEQPLRNYVQQWVAVYQQSIGEFVAGYKEGRQEARPPAPGEAAADDRPSPLEAFNEFSKQQPEAKSAAPPPSQSKSDATPRPPDAQA